MTFTVYQDRRNAEAYLTRLQALSTLATDDMFVLFSHGVYVMFVQQQEGGMAMENSDVVNATRLTKMEAQRLELVSKGLSMGLEVFSLHMALEQEITRVRNVIRSLDE